MSNLQPYIILHKKVGETPLECAENWRSSRPNLAGTPLAYAGRLDPLASGLLLILIGEECKRQESYHALDKTYEISILFGISSDSGDVLGIVKEDTKRDPDRQTLKDLINELPGKITLPYPIFSSRTVKGKPLHTWAMEGRLSEIKIPSKTSTIYKISLDEIEEVDRAKLVELAKQKIDSIPPVKDMRKALGNDFRRSEVRPAWDKIAQSGSSDDKFTIAHISCTCSSGTYMRSLASEIAKRLNATGLALNIHRSAIGHFDKTTSKWSKVY
jgi:tRNA pseudouridine55 synthase